MKKRSENTTAEEKLGVGVREGVCSLYYGGFIVFTAKLLIKFQLAVPVVQKINIPEP